MNTDNVVNLFDKNIVSAIKTKDKTLIPELTYNLDTLPRNNFDDYMDLSGLFVMLNSYLAQPSLDKNKIKRKVIVTLVGQIINSKEHIVKVSRSFVKLLQDDLNDVRKKNQNKL